MKKHIIFFIILSIGFEFTLSGCTNTLKNNINRSKYNPVHYFRKPDKPKSTLKWLTSFIVATSLPILLKGDLVNSQTTSFPTKLEPSTTIETPICSCFSRTEASGEMISYFFEKDCFWSMGLEVPFFSSNLPPPCINSSNNIIVEGSDLGDTADLKESLGLFCYYGDPSNFYNPYGIKVNMNNSSPELVINVTMPNTKIGKNGTITMGDIFGSCEACNVTHFHMC